MHKLRYIKPHVPYERPEIETCHLLLAFGNSSLGKILKNPIDTMPALSHMQLRSVVAGLAQKLDVLRIDYAIMGGAAVCLLANDPTRMTADVDLVIHVDQRMITADRLTTQLITSYPAEFAPINQYGHTIPAYKLNGHLVELEIFDYQSWPQRPQYNIQTASRRTIDINGHPVKTFSPEWILREKILSQHQRQGSVKEATDIRDLTSMLPLAGPGKPELNFNDDQNLRNALSNLLQKRPALEQRLRQKIRCTAIFGHWYALLLIPLRSDTDRRVDFTV
jgi:hypothetical protein